MSMMYKIFFAIMGTGAIGGGLFALWSRAFGSFGEDYWLFLALSAAIGLVWGFVNYILIKVVLRIFVNKFHTLERVLVHTNPDELANVFLSNEIDEIEASIVRISDQFNKLSTQTLDSAPTIGVSGRPSRYSGRVSS